FVLRLRNPLPGRPKNSARALHAVIVPMDHGRLPVLGNPPRVPHAVDMREPTLLPWRSCFQIPLIQLSAAPSWDCSNLAFKSRRVPVGKGRDSGSPSREDAQQMQVAQDSRRCDPFWAEPDQDIDLSERVLLRKRFYILFVARGDDGQLRKIPIPIH